MRLLRIMECMAAVMVIAAIVLALGKVAVDQIVYVSSHPVSLSMTVRPVTDDEKRGYIASMRESLRVMESKDLAEMRSRVPR